MNKRRWSIAVVAVALLAFAGTGAEAGRGRVKTSSSLELKDGKITSNRKVSHNRGLRGKLTGGRLGKTIAIESNDSAGESRRETKRGGSRVSRDFTPTADGGGSSAKGVHDRRRFFVFGRATQLERTDIVTRQNVTQDAVQHRTLRRAKRSIRTHKRGAPNGVEQVGYRDGTQWVAEPGLNEVGSQSRAWGGKLKGNRVVMDTPGGMRLEDSQNFKYGRVGKVVTRILTAPITLATAILTLGTMPVTFGKTQKMQLREWQDPSGQGFELTTPRDRVVSNTTDDGRRSETVTTTFRKGVQRETETTNLWKDVGVSTRRINDRRGRTKKIVHTRLLPDGTHSEWTTHLRRDGSVSKVAVKESRPRADKPSKSTVTRNQVKYPKGTRAENVAPEWAR
jgi:hypothetical protein